MKEYIWTKEKIVPGDFKLGTLLLISYKYNRGTLSPDDRSKCRYLVRVDSEGKPNRKNLGFGIDCGFKIIAASEGEEYSGGSSELRISGHTKHIWMVERSDLPLFMSGWNLGEEFMQILKEIK